MDKQAEYKKIYIQESDELLQQMNSNLLILEKNPSNKEALNAIFRSAHTLKSMSASMGYGTVSELAHKMEDVLEQLRSDKISVNERTVEILFNTFDVLESMVRTVQDGKIVTKDITSISANLDNLLIKAPKFEESKINDEISLNEFEKKTLARADVDRFFCYHIKVTLEKNCVLKSVRAFMVFRNLHSIGEVIKSYPDSQSLEEEKFELGFGCIFITKEKKEAVVSKVMEVLDVEKVSIDVIKPEKEWIKGADISPLNAFEESQSSPQEQSRKIQSVRVDISRLDKLINLVEELTINKLRLNVVSGLLKHNDLKNVVEQQGRLIDDLQLEVMRARLVPVEQIFDRFPRLIRDLVKKEGKKVDFEITGGDIELDRTVLDEIGDPLIHLLRNSVDHGIELPAERIKNGKPESGKIILSARREKDHVFIDVEDDGRGMDPEQIRKKAVSLGLISEEDSINLNNSEVFLLTAKQSFSTNEVVTDVSGRGVGLDVVKQKAEKLGGGILIESKFKVGSKISMRLPVTTAVVRVLLVQAVSKTFAIPLSSVLEIVVVDMDSVKEIDNCETILYRGMVLPIIRLENSVSGPRQNVVVVEFGDKKFGIVVDRLLNQQNVVIKQLSNELRGIKGVAGATILGDGNVALVLDVASLA